MWAGSGGVTALPSTASDHDGVPAALPVECRWLVASYLFRATDVAALAAVWGLAPRQHGPCHTLTLSYLSACWEQPPARRPQLPSSPIEVVVSADEGAHLAKIAVVAPLAVLATGLGLDVTAMQIQDAVGFDLARHLREPRSHAMIAPVCPLWDLRIETACTEQFAAACAFISQTVFPCLETLWLAYSGRDRPACLSELTIGFQCRRFPRLRVLTLGPLPAALTGQVWADTEVSFLGYVWHGSSLGRRPAATRPPPGEGDAPRG